MVFSSSGVHLGNWVFLGLCFSCCNAPKIGNLRSSGSGSLFYVYMLIGLRLIDISDSLAWLYIFACGTKFCSLNFLVLFCCDWKFS